MTDDTKLGDFSDGESSELLETDPWNQAEADSAWQQWTGHTSPHGQAAHVNLGTYDTALALKQGSLPREKKVKRS